MYRMYIPRGPLEGHRSNRDPVRFPYKIHGLPRACQRMRGVR
eukprot:COSAG02_NODE_22782_length_740_cov_1.115445_1_plen_41_part_01